MKNTAPKKQRIVIVGGGAAGFFAAIKAKETYPEAQVEILEKSRKVLGKVKISGGGRCNVTNACRRNSELLKAYPRGRDILKPALQRFSTQDTIDWFESQGVRLVTQEDQCIFPATQNSQTIIDALVNRAHALGIKIKLQHNVKKLSIDSDSQVWTLELQPDTRSDASPGARSIQADQLIIATGGTPKPQQLKWLNDLGISTIDPVPSLFTFNMPHEPITALMGVVVEPALAKIPGTKLEATGPLLITHWGMSGPAILKLSAYGARLLADKAYDFRVLVNWLAMPNQSEVETSLRRIIEHNPRKHLQNIRPFGLSDRLWRYLIARAELPVDKRWSELGKKQINQLIQILTNDGYQVEGKTTFKEEFVTAGGVDTQAIHPKTLASQQYANLFFAGEILDIDGITGGYNFQAAWTTGFIAGHLGKL